MNINISMTGLDAVMKDFSVAGVKAQVKADKIAETYARKMANEAAALSPKDTHDLELNLLASPERVATGVWQYGGTLAYTRRQEYEHSTNKGFIRRSSWNNREAYRNALKREVLKF